MKWYNWLFDRLGHRRLMTRLEFWDQVRSEVSRGELRVVPKRQHQLLLDIAALSNLLIQPKSKDSQAHIMARLEEAVIRYKMLEQDENIPPSTNRREITLMEIP